MPPQPPAPYSAIRLCRVPDLAPPYDDDPPAEIIPPRPDTLTVPPRPDTLAVPSSAPNPPRAEGRGTVWTEERWREERAPGATREDSASQAPAGERDNIASAASQWPSQFAQVLAETLAGARPPGQITKWTTERARSRIRSLGPVLTAGRQAPVQRVQPRVHRVVTSRPAAGVVEMSVVVGFGDAVRALAVRLERTAPQPARPGRPAQGARWLCTALEVA
jgi:Family of unknown function (DUF6459)